MIQRKNIKLGPPAVCVKILADMQEAKIMKPFLQSNGIEADLFFDNFANYLGESSNSIKILVKEEDKKSAEKLLTEMQSS